MLLRKNKNINYKEITSILRIKKCACIYFKKHVRFQKVGKKSKK